MERFFTVFFVICVIWWLWTLVFLGIVLGAPWLFKKCKQAKHQRQTKNLLEQWGIQTYDYDPNWQPTVYFLNSGGRLLSLSLLDFSRLNMPKDEMPQWWILLLWTGKEKSVKQNRYYLIHNGEVDLHHWHLKSYFTMNGYGSILKLHLYDRDGKTVILNKPSDQATEQFIQEVLEHVSTFRDVNDFWIKAVQKEGVPLLLETKDTMGKSPRLEAFRRVLETGPTSFLEVGESILPNILV